MKTIASIIAIAATVLLVAFKGNFTVQGTVQDEQGNLIPFATVTLKGKPQAVATDMNGNFSITVPEKKGTLVFSAIGYEDVEYTIGGTLTGITVIMKKNPQALSDVVVVAGVGINKEKKALGYALRPGLSGHVSGLYIKTNQEPERLEEDERYPYPIHDDTDFNTEGYSKITDNPFLSVNQNPLSTFSIDVDGAAYSNVRRFINQRSLPPAGAIRIEELINYFSYDYAQPKNDHPFAVQTELVKCPWNKAHHLALIALQGKKIEEENLPPSNLVFLVDVSGSMMDENKLPLVKASLELLTEKLRPQDKVALVVYAGAAGLVLDATPGNQKAKIREAIQALEAGGSTAGGDGIKLAYKTARKNFMQKGNNRIILCTDGDFNVGESSDDAMERLIEQERKSGVFLSVLGFGMGNYQDAKMQILADKGNGNHAYIDGISEAKKVFVNEFGGTLFTIAKDVKLQIEFNPAMVKGYRLIGYENRMLAKEDFNNDAKDAGELGSGHTVTALYEIIPAGSNETIDDVDALRYQKNTSPKESVSFGSEYMFVKLRYKKPDGDKSILLTHPVNNQIGDISKSTSNIQFAASVAAFGMLLRNSPHKGDTRFDLVYELAQNAIGTDLEGYRKEYLRLVRDAAMLSREADTDQKSK